MDVAALVIAIMAAVGLVAVLGFPIGMLAWLLLYGIFRLATSALLRHIGH